MSSNIIVLEISYHVLSGSPCIRTVFLWKITLLLVSIKLCSEFPESTAVGWHRPARVEHSTWYRIHVERLGLYFPQVLMGQWLLLNEKESWEWYICQYSYVMSGNVVSAHWKLQGIRWKHFTWISLFSIVSQLKGTLAMRNWHINAESTMNRSPDTSLIARCC